MGETLLKKFYYVADTITSCEYKVTKFSPYHIYSVLFSCYSLLVISFTLFCTR